MKIKKEKFGLGELWGEKRLVFLAEKSDENNISDYAQNTVEVLNRSDNKEDDTNDLEAIRGTDSKATKAVLEVSNKWFRNWRGSEKKIIPINSFKEGVVRAIDRHNETTAKLGENLTRGALSKIGFTGEKAMKEMERLVKREESAKKVSEDARRRVAEIQARKLTIQKLSKQVPIWQPWLKTSAKFEQMRGGLANTVGATLRIGQQERLMNKLEHTAAIIASEASAKTQNIANRFQEKIQNDNEKRKIIFTSLSIEENEYNNQIIDALIKSQYKLNDYGLNQFGSNDDTAGAEDFVDKIEKLKKVSPPDYRAVLLLLKSMRRSRFKEAKVIDFRAIHNAAQQRTEKEKEAKQARQAQLKLNNFFNGKIRKLKTGGQIKLTFTGRENLDGDWAIKKIEKDNSEKEKVLTLEKNNKTIILNRKNRKTQVRFNKEDIADDLTNIKIAA